VPSGIPNENLAVVGGGPRHEVLEVRERYLAAAAIERTAVSNGSRADFPTHLEGVMAAQVGKTVNEFEDVVRTVVLREAGTATSAAGEVRQRNVCETAYRLRRTVTERYAVIRLTITRALAVRSFEFLIEMVEAETQRIHDRRTFCVVPLRS